MWLNTCVFPRPVFHCIHASLYWVGMDASMPGRHLRLRYGLLVEGCGWGLCAAGLLRGGPQPGLLWSDGARVLGYRAIGGGQGHSSSGG